MNLVSSVVSHMSNTEIHLPVPKLLIQNLLLMFLPILIGYLFKLYLPESAIKVSKILGKLAFPALMTLALVFFIQHRAGH